MGKKAFMLSLLLLMLVFNPFKNVFVAASDELPSKYDLRELNKLTPVKEQGELGSCWAVAGTAALESYLKVKEGIDYDFSENNVITQLSSFYDESFKRNYADGGDDSMLAGYYAAWRGPVLEKDDPYTLQDKKDNADVITGLKPVKHVQEIEFLPERKGPLDNTIIKQHVMKYGAVTAAMWKGTPQTFGEFYNQDHYAWYYPYNYMNKEGNGHEVDIVGWDDSFSKNNFAIVPPGDGAFIAKNTKGPLWGREDRSSNMGGYFYISYYDGMLGTKLDGNVGCSSFTRVDNTDNYDNIYQYDILGYTKAYNAGSREATFGNIFKIDKGHNESLSAVSFYTLNKDIRYEIWINANYNGPNSFLNLTKVKEGNIEMPGYHTVDLDAGRELLHNSRAAVIVKLFSCNENPLIAVEAPDGTNPSNCSSNQDESYVYFKERGAWADLGSIMKNTNACLKIFTKDSDKPEDMISTEKMRIDVDYLVKWIKEHQPVVMNNGYSKEQQQIIDTLYKKIEKPLRISDYYMEVNRLFTMLGDGHDILNWQPGEERFLNVSFKWLEEGLIVDKNLGNYRIGDKILSIGGKTPEELNKKLYEVQGAENDYWIRASGEKLLNPRIYLRYLRLINDDDTVDIKILRDNKIYVFKEKFKNTLNIYDKNDKWIMWHIEKENNLGYFRFDEFASGDGLEEIKRNMDSFFKEVADENIGNIAIDLRYNNGGTAGALNYLCRYLDYENFYAEGYMNYGMDKTFPKADDSLIFKGNVYVMTSNETFSCAVYATGLLKDNNIVTTIGEPTGENPAFIRHMEAADSVLPGSGWGYMMAGYKPQRPYFLDPNEITIYPDIPVYTTRSDLLSGRDMAMEKLRQISVNNGYIYYNYPLDLKAEDNITVSTGEEFGMEDGKRLIIRGSKDKLLQYNFWMEDTEKHKMIMVNPLIYQNGVSIKLPQELSYGKGYNLVIDTGEESYCYLIYIKNPSDGVNLENGSTVSENKPIEGFYVRKESLIKCYKPWSDGLIAIQLSKQVSPNIDLSKIYFTDKDGNKIPVKKASVVGDDKTVVYIFPAVKLIKGESYRLFISSEAFTSIDNEKCSENIEVTFIVE